MTINYIIKIQQIKKNVERKYYSISSATLLSLAGQGMPVMGQILPLSD